MRGKRKPQFPDGAEDVLLGRIVPDADRLRNLGNRSPLEVPERELEETRAKARGMLRAFGAA